jgi:hypothetical protein
MGVFAPIHILVVLCIFAIAVAFLIPIYKIISRTGHSGWWCLIAFVPLLNWIFVWVFAFSCWPAVDRT